MGGYPNNSDCFGYNQCMVHNNVVKHTETISVIAIALLVSIGNLYQLFYYFFKRPPYTIYIGITHWYEDYFYYLSQLKQGAMGSWLVSNKFTTEPVPPSLNWFVNLFIGKLGHLFGLEPWQTFAVSAFLFSIGYLFFMYWVIRKLFPRSLLMRLAALAVAIVSNGFYKLDVTGAAVKIIPYEYFYNYTSAFNRLGGVPHLILQNIASLVGLVVFSDVIKTIINNKILHFRRIIAPVILCSGLMALLFIINPIYVFVDGLVMGITALGYGIVSKKINVIARFMSIFAIMLIPLVLLVVIQLPIFRHPFYQYFRQWEASIPPTSISNFILATGAIAILIPLGLKPYWQQKEPLCVIGLIYVFLPIILYFSPIPKMLTIPSFRILQPPAYVFMAAIAVEGLLSLAQFITWIIRSRYANTIFLLLLFLFVAIQIPVIAKTIDERTHDVILDSPLNYFDKDLYQALTFLGSQPSNKTVVATGNLELFVPVVSGHTVYAGHRSLTLAYEKKTAEIFNLYALHYSSDQARTFFSANNIGYMLWQKDRGNYHTVISKYPFLNVLFENDRLVIFAVT